jgi:hypothetical protein
MVHATREAGYQAFLKRLTNPPPLPSGPAHRWEFVGLEQAIIRKPGSKDLLAEWVAPPMELDHLVRLPLSTVPAMTPGRATALAVYSRRVSYESSMRRKYEWLADHPWESATPDPPPPG